MKNRFSKYIAPIIITILMICYLSFFIFVCLFSDMPLVATIFFGIVILSLVAVSIYVLIERIKEIRSGEEDDLSKY